MLPFKGLFDSSGNAIIDWNGTGAVYDAYGNLMWDGLGLSADQAIAAYGSSYLRPVTDSWGLRDLSGP